MISLRGVRKSYDDGRSFAVDSVDLSVDEGELLVLWGESGCGKTTTLKMINRLVEPTAGTIEVQGSDIRDVNPVELRRRIGYVIQSVGLFGHMTVAQNVAVVPRLLKWAPSEVERRVEELLNLVQLPPGAFADRHPSQLSGGQQQRVGLARALAAKPRIMLMDEPLGALDPLTRDDLADEYRRIHDQAGLTTVMVTHDMTEALLMADRIAVMQQGRIVRVGRPHELLSEPGDGYVSRLMTTPKRQASRLKAMISTSAGEGL